MPDTDPPNAAKGREAQIQLAVSGHCFLENNCQRQVQWSSVHPQISVLHWSTTYCPQNPILSRRSVGQMVGQAYLCLKISLCTQDCWWAVPAGIVGLLAFSVVIMEILVFVLFPSEPITLSILTNPRESISNVGNIIAENFFWDF